MLISIVVPVYNEKQNIGPLAKAVKSALARKKLRYELLFIDDGSTDGTFQEILKQRKRNKRIRAVRFRKNFGQTAAFDAGFDYSTGDVIVTMDGDLQNDPSDIPALLKELNKGYDVVSGWRHDRKDSASKTIPSTFSNFLARRLTGLELHDFGCSLKAYKRKTLKNLHLFGEMHRFIPAILYSKGFSISEVKVKHHPRKYGSTKYNLNRLLKGFLDLLYIRFWSSFSTRPLHLFGLIGFILFGIAGIIGAYKLLALLAYAQPIEVTPILLLSALLMIIGLQFIIFGFLGEVQVRTYYNTSEEKEYEIGEKA